jgi:hypothetical protein
MSDRMGKRGMGEGEKDKEMGREKEGNGGRLGCDVITSLITTSLAVKNDF